MVGEGYTSSQQSTCINYTNSKLLQTAKRAVRTTSQCSEHQQSAFYSKDTGTRNKKEPLHTAHNRVLWGVDDIVL